MIDANEIRHVADFGFGDGNLLTRCAARFPSELLCQPRGRLSIAGDRPLYVRCSPAPPG
jgi:hypothetical protein